MDWNELMKNELRKAGLEIRVQKVPKSRCASSSSVMELNQRIDHRIRENEAMCTRSRSIAASVSIM